MNGSRAWLGVVLVSTAGLTTAPALGTTTDALAAVQVLRQGGCGGIVPAARPLQHEWALDAVAQQWAEGLPLAAAAERSGYPALATSGLRVSSTGEGALELLRRTACRNVTGRDLRAIGIYRRGLDSWVVMTSEYRSPVPAAPGARTAPSLAAATLPESSGAPAPSPTRVPTASVPALAAQALQLVNDLRAHGARCGPRTLAPAPPLLLSGTLASVAFGHAADMAEHDYFEHEDLTGASPADRVRAVGYREKLVGENIAYGPKTLEEVVQGWLDSPGHCENLMDPRFVEMGIAYAAGRTGRHGLYWVQLLAEPRA
jgi:uncharacterized protein YkwD